MCARLRGSCARPQSGKISVTSEDRGTMIFSLSVPWFRLSTSSSLAEGIGLGLPASALLARRPHPHVILRP
ncbi:MAG: hypothetical protein LBK99_09580 [Opitutaceae bacterium]|nr:hypothetical protein [Opitutaceae bacterium]